MSLPHQQPDGSVLTFAQVAERARLIEQVGFDGIWIGDSIGRGPRPRPDPLMYLAVAAVLSGTAPSTVPQPVPTALQSISTP